MLNTVKDRSDLREVQGCTVTAIVVVPVHVEDLLPLDGQETGQNALREASAENDDLGRVSIVASDFCAVYAHHTLHPWWFRSSKSEK